MASTGTTGLCKRCAHNSYRQGTSDGRSGGSVPKLTVEQLAEARRMRAQFKTQVEIARHFGLNVQTMREYLRGDRKPRPSS